MSSVSFNPAMQGPSISGGSSSVSDTSGNNVKSSSNTWSQGNDGSGDLVKYAGGADASNQNGTTATQAGSTVMAGPSGASAGGAQSAISKGDLAKAAEYFSALAKSGNQSAVNTGGAHASADKGTANVSGSGMANAGDGLAQAGGLSNADSQGDGVDAATQSQSTAASDEFEAMCNQIAQWAKAQLTTKGHASGGENKANSTSSSLATAKNGQANVAGGSQGQSFAHGFQHVDGQTTFNAAANRGGSLLGASNTHTEASLPDPTFLTQGQASATS